MATKFFLTGPHEGKTIVLGGFQFRNGVFETSDDHAGTAAPILQRFYSCVTEFEYKTLQRVRELEREAADAAKQKADSVEEGIERGKESATAELARAEVAHEEAKFAEGMIEAAATEAIRKTRDEASSVEARVAARLAPKSAKAPKAEPSGPIQG